MAGTRAGYMYITFPTMNGSWVAPQWGMMQPWWKDLTMNADSIHFLHRTLAWVVLIWGVGLAVRAWRHAHDACAPIGKWLGYAVLLQFILGVATIMSGMNITLAALHQGGAFVLLSITIMLLLKIWRAKSPLVTSH